MDTTEITRNLADSALIERIRAGLESAKNWSDPIFRAMSGWDFEAALSEFPEAKEFAVAVHELTLRAEKLEHESREALLSAIHPLPDQLKPAKAFFARLAPEIGRIRELEAYWRNNEAARQRDRENGIARIAISCFQKDVERIREFVKKVNAESRFDETAPRKKPGRPRKNLTPAETPSTSASIAASAVPAEAAPSSPAAASVEATPSSPAEEPRWGREETAEERAARKRREALLKRFV
jgi:hypothetical protein